jgi:hypothetical protein
MLSAGEHRQILTGVDGRPGRARRALASLDARNETGDNPELVAALTAIATPEQPADALPPSPDQPAEALAAEPDAPPAAAVERPAPKRTPRAKA